MEWTGERVDELRRMYGIGMSGSEIAAELGGGLSRNAVIGKIHRLHLPLRGKTTSTGRPPKPKEAKPNTRRVERIVRAGRNHASLRLIETQEPIEMLRELPASEIPIAQRKTILELTEDTCRYPYGEPGTSDFFFCGGEPLPCLPYCAMHARIAYQPSSPKRVLSDEEHARRSASARRRGVTGGPPSWGGA